MTQAWRSGAPAGQKMVLLALCDNANDQGECRPSVPYLARKCSMGESTVRGHISDMEDAGILHRQFRTGRSTFYFIHPDNFVPAPDEKPPQNLHPPESAPPQNSAHSPADAGGPPPQNLAPTPSDTEDRTTSKPSKEPSGKRKKRGEAAADPFCPRTSLLALGVEEKVIDGWLIHRKAKKAAISELVIDAFVREAGAAGVSVEFALRYSVEANWAGFRADWYAARTQPPAAGRPAPFNPTAHVNRGRNGGGS